MSSNKEWWTLDTVKISIPKRIIAMATLGQTGPLEMFIVLNLNNYKDPVFFLYRKTHILSIQGQSEVNLTLFDFEDWLIEKKIAIHKCMLGELSLWREINNIIKGEKNEKEA